MGTEIIIHRDIHSASVDTKRGPDRFEVCLRLASGGRVNDRADYDFDTVRIPCRAREQVLEILSGLGAFSEASITSITLGEHNWPFGHEVSDEQYDEINEWCVANGIGMGTADYGYAWSFSLRNGVIIQWAPHGQHMTVDGKPSETQVQDWPKLRAMILKLSLEANA